MNTQRLHLTTLATMIVSVMVFGCASSTLVDAPSKPMTVQEAQKSIIQSLNNLRGVVSVLEAQCTRQRLTFKVDYKWEKHCTYDFTVKFRDLRNLTVEGNVWFAAESYGSVNSDGKPVLSVGGRRGLDFVNAEVARIFADCLLTLRNSLLAPSTEEPNFAAFSASAKTWLAAESKPPMPDAARLGKVKAEDAFKRKDFAAAMDAYVEALGIYPMWPEGHYNAALLAAECEDFGLAARHMRRYLALAPDAKDAAAAKDKLLLWQDKAKR